MYDLNDAGPQILPFVDASAYPQFDLPDIKDRLQRNLWWIEHFFPRGRRSSCRKFWCLADWSGREPSGEGSCRINLTGDRAGWGYDFTTQLGADPIKVIGFATGLSGVDLFREAARIAGSSGVVQMPKQAAPNKASDNAHYAANIIASAIPLKGTPGEKYLASRGLSDPKSPDLLYHPDLVETTTRRGYCGLVAIARHGNGEATGGIQRTYLTDDGSAKALGRDSRKSLGPIKGSSVRLAPIGDDGHVGIAEGVETALSATALFGVPCWASLGTDGMSSWEWPAEVRRVTIFADARKAGEDASQGLVRRLSEARIPFEVRAPIHGDDFNDDLRKGATAADYPVQVERPLAVVIPLIPAGADLEEFCSKLTNPPDALQLGQLLSMVVRAKLEPVDEHCWIGKIKKQTGVSVSALREQVRGMKKRLQSEGSVSGPAWLSHLRRDTFGNPERNEANVLTALKMDPAFAGVITYDEFRQEILVTKPMPWEDAEKLPRAWREVDDIRASEWMQRRDINVAPSIVSRAVQAVARENSFHPVRQYLGGLKWDGKPRLRRWTIDYLGAADEPLNAAFGSKWMISAVARIFRPGCKADCMIILEGPQGAQKSSALKALAGDEWFTDHIAEVGSKDAAQQLSGVWIIEMAEMDAIGRADVSRIKAFLTSTTDRYRPAYERYVVSVPRQCVFAGSVNPDAYLRDETGNRRFWPVRCGRIDIDGIKASRDQLWAEAVVMFKAGETWWLDDQKLIAAAEDAQAQRYMGDAWDERISHWIVYNWEIGAMRPEPLTDVSVGEVLQGALRLEPSKWSRADQMRVSTYLKQNGWVRYNSRIGEARMWRYRAKVPTSAD